MKEKRITTWQWRKWKSKSISYNFRSKQGLTSNDSETFFFLSARNWAINHTDFTFDNCFTHYCSALPGLVSWFSHLAECHTGSIGRWWSFKGGLGWYLQRRHKHGVFKWNSDRGRTDQGWWFDSAKWRRVSSRRRDTKSNRESRNRWQETQD